MWNSNRIMLVLVDGMLVAWRLWCLGRVLKDASAAGAAVGHAVSAAIQDVPRPRLYAVK